MTVNGYESPYVTATTSLPALPSKYRPKADGKSGQECEMVYLWRYADEAGVVADGPAVSFGSQEEAESWLSESYGDLLDEGISAVSLFNDLQAVYGPMELAE